MGDTRRGIRAAAAPRRPRSPGRAWRGYLRLGVAAGALFAAGGCRSYVAAEREPDAAARLGFVQPGETRREVIRGRLGEPHSRYEADRVWIYLLRPAPGEEGFALAQQLDRARPEGCACTAFDLVLEFTPDGTLARRALVRVR